MTHGAFHYIYRVEINLRCEKRRSWKVLLIAIYVHYLYSIVYKYVYFFFIIPLSISFSSVLRKENCNKYHKTISRIYFYCPLLWMWKQIFFNERSKRSLIDESCLLFVSYHRFWRCLRRDYLQRFFPARKATNGANLQVSIEGLIIGSVRVMDSFWVKYAHYRENSTKKVCIAYNRETKKGFNKRLENISSENYVLHVEWYVWRFFITFVYCFRLRE